MGSGSLSHPVPYVKGIKTCTCSRLWFYPATALDRLWRKTSVVKCELLDFALS